MDLRIHYVGKRPDWDPKRPLLVAIHCGESQRVTMIRELFLGEKLGVLLDKCIGNDSEGNHVSLLCDAFLSEWEIDFETEISAVGNAAMLAIRQMIQLIRWSTALTFDENTPENIFDDAKMVHEGKLDGSNEPQLWKEFSQCIAARRTSEVAKGIDQIANTSQKMRQTLPTIKRHLEVIANLPPHASMDVIEQLHCIVEDIPHLMASAKSNFIELLEARLVQAIGAHSAAVADGVQGATSMEELPEGFEDIV